MLVILANGKTATREFWLLALPLAAILAISGTFFIFAPEPFRQATNFVEIRQKHALFFWVLMAIVVFGIALNFRIAYFTTITFRVPSVYYVGMLTLVLAFVVALVLPLTSAADSGRPFSVGQFAISCAFVYLTVLDIIQHVSRT